MDNNPFPLSLVRPPVDYDTRPDLYASLRANARETASHRIFGMGYGELAACMLAAAFIGLVLATGGAL